MKKDNHTLSVLMLGVEFLRIGHLLVFSEEEVTDDILSCPIIGALLCRLVTLLQRSHNCYLLKVLPFLYVIFATFSSFM